LPGEAEQAGDNLVAMAMTHNVGLQLAASDVRGKEFRLKGERRGYWPTLELVSIYSVLAQFNNFSSFSGRFSGTISTLESTCACRFSARRQKQR